MTARLGGSETVPTERAENVVPCSTESQFPYLWSTPVHSTHWMPMDGDQEHMKWAFPAAMATPESTTGTPRPHTRFQEKPVGLATAAR